LSGKIALITGGTSGIGLATAKQFVKEGAYTFITERRETELNAAVKEMRRNVSGVHGKLLRPNGLISIQLLTRQTHLAADEATFCGHCCNPLFGGNLDYRSEGPSYPLKRCQSGSDQYGESAISKRDCADCVHCTDGTHGGAR
jgi:short chain dehydrogenase